VKKIYAILMAVIIAMATLAVAGYAYAQTQSPPNLPGPFGPGLMGPGMRGGGMMGRWGDSQTRTHGPLHKYMLRAFAAKLGLTSDEIQAQLDAGETMWTIASAQGISQEDFSAWMTEARTQALAQAVADGVLTQEQAEWMGQRMQRIHANGYGLGNCPMQGGKAGGRWNNRP
jgi:hypothetical protein